MILTDNTVIAGGCGDDVFFAGGRYISGKEIYDVLVGSDKVYDACFSDDTVYYTMRTYFTAAEIRSTLKDKIGEAADALTLIEVPYIPKDKDGIADREALKKMIGLDLKIINELNNKFNDEFDGKCYAALDYENISDGIIIEENEESVHENIEIIAENEDSFLKLPDINYSKQKFSTISEVIVGRATSKQKILYIDIDGEYEQSYGELYEESSKVAAALLE